MAKIIGMANAKSPDKTLYDPTCGSGSLLLRAADESPKGVTIYGQEMDNATAALAREAEQAESKADFIHKMAIALKEANESDYWIELLFRSDYLDQKSYQSIQADLTELLKLLTAIIKTAKARRS